jgi:hypothetical protein
LNILANIFSGIGQGIVGDLSTVENYALDAFYVLAGELLLVILLLGAILIWGVAVL